jgi:hypothetical protein
MFTVVLSHSKYRNKPIKYTVTVPLLAISISPHVNNHINIRLELLKPRGLIHRQTSMFQRTCLLEYHTKLQLRKPISTTQSQWEHQPRTYNHTTLTPDDGQCLLRCITQESPINCLSVWKRSERKIKRQNTFSCGTRAFKSVYNNVVSNN